MGGWGHTLPPLRTLAEQRSAPVGAGASETVTKPERFRVRGTYKVREKLTRFERNRKRLADHGPK